MEGSQFTASMNREMLHDQYPLYKYILVCEFCYSECPTILFLGKLNQSGARRVILCWIHFADYCYLDDSEHLQACHFVRL